MKITATHIDYLHICHRKLWLFSNGIHMEHNSERVYEGKQLHETSYPQRAEKYTELEMDGIKIDFYDATNKAVHEIKKIKQVGKCTFCSSKILYMGTGAKWNFGCKWNFGISNNS